MANLKIIATVLATAALAVSVWASESDELRERSQAMQREAAELAANGHAEEAENLERKALAMLEEAEHLDRHRPDQREAEKIERALHVMSRDGHREHSDSHEAIASRLEHMRIAVEHLHHAGLHDIAEHVAERAEVTEREFHERHRHHDGDPIHALMEQLDEIRNEVGRLRDDLNELKERR